MKCRLIKKSKFFFIPPPPLSTTTESFEEDEKFPPSTHYFLNTKRLPPNQEQEPSLTSLHYSHSKPQSKESSIHTKYYFDNILHKINILYYQFLIYFINNCIKNNFQL